MAIILSIETATNICSVALHENGKPLASQSLFKSQSHSGLLAPVINGLIKNCHLEKSNLDAVAISEGPGSYTGLRIGTSTAKGICDALEIPLIAINTLEALVYGVKGYINADSLLCPMLDARRMEVYTLLCDSDLKIRISTKPMVINEESFSLELEKNKIYFFGNGANKCKEVIKSENAVFLDGINTDAFNMGTLAFEKFLNNQFVDVAYFEPFYLKEFRITKPKAKK